MSDLHLPEDEAVSYVLGELPADERELFEERLKQSADLRALVRDLEEGTVGLSMASPRQQAPRRVWANIERELNKRPGWGETLPAIWVRWWRSGWAAAAACLIGWLLYALWVNPAQAPQTSSAALSSKTSTPDGKSSGNTASSKAERDGASSPTTIETHIALQMLQARTREVAALKQQIAGLTNQVVRLSGALRQQQALLAEPDRIKFVQLAVSSNGAPVMSAAPISTNLQRALFLAMARELGWLPPSAFAEATSAGNSDSLRNENGGSVTTNGLGVDFVDLRRDSNGVLQPTVPNETGNEANTATEAPTLAVTASNTVPGWISPTNAVFAFDTSIAPEGSSIQFWSTAADGQYHLQAGSVLGGNAMVMSMPTTALFDHGSTVTIFATTPSGQVNIIGEVTSPVSISP